MNNLNYEDSLNYMNNNEILNEQLKNNHHLSDNNKNDETLNDETLNDETLNDETLNDETLNKNNIIEEIKEDNILKPEITLKTKEDLIHHIKEWIKIDKEISILKSELKEKNTLKKLFSTNLINVMKNNKVDCFDINGGSLVYKKSTVKKTISSKLLMNELEKIYKEQPELAKNLGEQILNAREEKINEFIKIKINK